MTSHLALAEEDEQLHQGNDDHDHAVHLRGAGGENEGTDCQPACLLVSGLGCLLCPSVASQELGLAKCVYASQDPATGPR